MGGRYAAPEQSVCVQPTVRLYCQSIWILRFHRRSRLRIDIAVHGLLLPTTREDIP